MLLLYQIIVIQPSYTKNVDDGNKISELPQTYIFISKKLKALIFRIWVTLEVLPSIKKIGSYNSMDNYIQKDLDKYYKYYR